MVQTVDDKFRHILDSFKAHLSSDEADDFSFTTLDDLKQAINDIQAEQASEKRLRNLRRLSAFLEAMDQYDKVVQIFLNTADLLAFIWTASNYVDALNTLLDAYEEIGEHIPLLKQYEDLVEQSFSLQDILCLIYQDILQFHQKAMKHFKNRVWKQLFHATWKTFRTDFRAVLDHLQSHKRLLDSQVALIGVQQTQQGMRKSLQFQSETESQFRNTRAMIEAESLRSQAESLRNHAEEEKLRKREVYNWLSAADSTADQGTAAEVRSTHHNTGRWILQQDSVRAWCNPTSPCEPCLWINGKPGAGKTILASIIIEECQALPSSDSAFFYCRYEDSTRSTFLGVSKSILLQLAQTNESIMSYIYEIASSCGRTQLDSAVLARQILDVALNSFNSLFLVIDGIDECGKKEKDQIVNVFHNAAKEHSTLLRCCFISQDDKDATRLFRGLPSFQITENHNEGDISEYCAGMETKIAASFDISPSDLCALNIASTVVGNAAGMFLFAKLVMENLLQQCSQEDLEREIESIPPDLDKVYDRLLVRILKESPEPEQLKANKLLCWLLCAQRPLKWHEIQGAMSFNPDDITFDYKMRRLTKDSKQLCGSLVEVQKGGTIEFVHQTARIYLEKRGDIKLPAEDVKFTCLCLEYLMLPSHDEGLSKDTIRGFVKDGYYAFSEYATVHWLDHVEKTGAGRALEAGESMDTLNGIVRSFLNQRLAPNLRQMKPKMEACVSLSRFKSQVFYTSLAQVATQHHNQRANKAESDEESLTTLITQLLSVRETVEEMALEQDSEQLQWLQQLYGSNLFKCSEQRCHSFHEGFSTSQERDRHTDKHKRAYRCTFPGCPALATGFTTASELKKHEIDYHQGLVDDTTFPWNGKASSIDICKEISKKNIVAVEAWADQWRATIPIASLWNPARGRRSPLRAAINCGDPKVLETLLQKAPEEILQASGKNGYQVLIETLETRNEGVLSTVTSRFECGIHDMVQLLLDKGNDLASALIPKMETATPSMLKIAIERGCVDSAALLVPKDIDIDEDLLLHALEQGYHNIASLVIPSMEKATSPLLQICLERGLEGLAWQLVPKLEVVTEDLVLLALGESYDDVASSMIPRLETVTPWLFQSAIERSCRNSASLLVPKLKVATPELVLSAFGKRYNDIAWELLPKLEVATEDLVLFLLTHGYNDTATATIPKLETVTWDPRWFALAPEHDNIVCKLIPRMGSLHVDKVQHILNSGFERFISPLLDQALSVGEAHIKSNGTLFVVMAIYNGRVDLVRHFVYNLDALLDEDGRKVREAIITTTRYSQVEICKLLFEYREQNGLLHDAYGQSIISELIWGGKENFVRKVLPLEEAEQWVNGITLTNHAYSGDIHNAKKIIEEGKANLNVASGQGYTPLHYAVHGGHNDLVEILANDPRVILDYAKKDSGVNPLHHAVLKNNYRTVEILLENGFPLEGLTCTTRPSNLNAIQMVGGDERISRLLHNYRGTLTDWAAYPRNSTPLLRFCAKGSLSMVRSSYRRAPNHLNEPDSRGVTPFLQAVKSGRHEIVRYLLSEGCEVDAVEHTARASYSALMSAVKNGDAEMVRLLLQENRVDPAFENEAGESAFSLVDPKCAGADQMREEIRDALDMRAVFQDVDG